MAAEAFTWAPIIALACGAVAGLGALHSAKRAFGFAVGLWLIQMVVWVVVLMIAAAERRPEHTDWNPDLVASFLTSLIVVTPYTAIGAVISGAVVGLLSRERGEDYLARR
jgi:hypothetical protein